MNPNSKASNVDNRKAKPGDVFLLLVPMAHDLQHMEAEQRRYTDLYGGHIVDFMHITVQRFSPENRGADDRTQTIWDVLKEDKGFMIYTDGIIQFSAPYWEKQVLRWRIAETEAFIAFRSRIKDTLAELDCPTLFHRIRRATCTMLTLDEPAILVQEHLIFDPPQRLFEVKQIIISQLHEDMGFKTLDTISLN